MIIEYNQEKYEISDKYSFKDFTGHNLTQQGDMDAIVIYGSCFSHEKPDSKVFPKDLMGTTFIKCNLDNCEIPDGNLIVDCSLRRFCCQNDLRDWEVDKDNKPTKLINEQLEKTLGKSIDPIDIPKERITSVNEIKKVGG